MLLNIDVRGLMGMTEKRFTYDSKTVSILKDGEFWLDGNIDTACNHSEICNELNKLTEENEQLKQALLFFVDVANSECSSNWREDMENDCQKLFNCSYNEAKEKYGNYDGSWWELG